MAHTVIASDTLDSFVCIGRNYTGHNYIDHDCIGHNYLGHNYTGHNHIGHNYNQVADVVSNADSDEILAFERPVLTSPAAAFPRAAPGSDERLGTIADQMRDMDQVENVRSHVS